VDAPQDISQRHVDLAEVRVAFAAALRNGDAKTAGSLYEETAPHWPI
jgi:hypothetical protein